MKDETIDLTIPASAAMCQRLAERRLKNLHMRGHILNNAVVQNVPKQRPAYWDDQIIREYVHGKSIDDITHSTGLSKA